MIKNIEKAVYIILGFFTGLFILSSFFMRAEYNAYLYGDVPVLHPQNLLIFIPLVILMLMVSMAVYRLCLRLNRYPKKLIIPLILLFSLGLQIGIIFAFPKLPEADARTVLGLAQAMLYKGDYSSFQTNGYLYMFPYNFSMVFYLKMLLSVLPNNYLVLKIFNILFSLVTSLMVYLIYKELNHRSQNNDYGVLLFAATYIPALFMCNFIYNDVIATAFLTSAVYCFIRFVKCTKVRFVVIGAVLLMFGNYFRNIGILVLIAAAIYFLLNLKPIGIKKTMLGIGLMLLLINIPAWTQDAVLQARHVVNASIYKNSAPIYMWINMGMNKSTIGYWDNRQSYQIYQGQGNYDKEKSTELFKAAIQKKLSNTTFSDLVKQYYEKTVWVWTEGTYQIEAGCIGNGAASKANSRMGPSGNVYSYTTVATDLFKGDSFYLSSLLWILYGMNFLMYGFILIRLAGGIKERRFDEVLIILIILGFIGFYILWEIKSRYIFPVYPLLIVLSYMGFEDAYDFLGRSNFLRSKINSPKVV
jgi:hypothetical protein